MATVFQESPTRYNISNKINVNKEEKGKCHVGVRIQEVREPKSNKRNNHNYNIRPSARR